MPGVVLALPSSWVVAVSVVYPMVTRTAEPVPLVKVVAGKKIKQILKDNEIESPLPEDLSNLVKKALKIREHMETNHKDLQGKKGLQRVESKIYRLIKYYKRTNILPQDFKYDPEKIRTLVAR